MTILNAFTIALNMDADTSEIFAAEPYFTTEILLDIDSEVRTIQTDLFGRQYTMSDLFVPINELLSLYTTRTLFDDDGLEAARITNIDVNVSPLSSIDPVKQNFSEIFSGSDQIFGSLLADTIRGFGGNDFIRASSGDDLIYGNQGGDIIYGNLGGDTIYAGQDSDSAFGGQGSDIVYGNLATDVIYGNLGSDDLFGGADNDAVFGGQGNDNLHGNKGNDFLNGGLGSDTFWFTSNGGSDTIGDYDDSLDAIAIQSNINGSGITSAADAVAAASQSGSDVVIDLGDGNQVTLSDISLGVLDQSDFVIF